MADLSGETVSSEAETSDNWSDEQSENWSDEQSENWSDEESENWSDEERENWSDEQSGEKLSACLEGTYWNRLPVEMQIEILKQKSLNDGNKLNLLCAYPELLSVISKSYPHDNPNAANGGKDTEAKPPSGIYIRYVSFQSSKKKMFYGRMTEFFGSRQPHRIIGLKYDEVVLVTLDSKSKHTATLLDALESTSTTTRKLYFDANEVDFQLVLAFVKVLKPSYLQLDFSFNEQGITFNELAEAFPALFELNELNMCVPIHADGDSLLSHFSKFPPSLCFDNACPFTPFEGFLHIGDIVKFLRTLVSTKFEEGSPAAVALKRIVNWKFEMSYETVTEEGATTNGYKLLSELVADIIPPDSEIMNLDSAMGTVERRIFELHLAVGDEQHVIYVKEEVDHLHEDRSIQLANRIEDLNEILESPDGSIMSDMDEQMSTSDSDPDSDMVDSDEDEDYPDYDDFEDDDY
ncbi:hypothetical protein WR25_08655 [Diploscapter pachys]|uniref:Uncharacterized protein n=1 Tax=Diploscapter pachys TaxID=2018661 RepID=A0A2A2LNZ7_9BILA|nr:hypothetical protein WR25_08655 [Diploscapter pachys]